MSNLAELALKESERIARGERPQFDPAQLQRALAKEQATATPVDAPLNEVEAFLARFVAYPSEHARVAHVLWIAHTHCMEAWDSTPRLAFLSPEPGSGKSRALEVTELLVPRPVEAVNVTAAYLFRKVGADEGRPTILFDEVDTVFGAKTAQNNEDIRGLLNAGHRRHGVAGRCVVVGKRVKTEEIPAYCAVAMAGLGDLPDTILTRSVIVRMRRRAPGEVVEPFRRRDEQAAGDELRERLQAWTDGIADDLTAARPAMPPNVCDRNADVWEALLAIADAAGGTWPERVRVSAVSLVSDAMGKTPSLGVRLLADLRQVFGDAEALSTETIIKKLCALEEAPWGDLRGKPIDARGIGTRLGVYGVKSKTVRADGQILKGYSRTDLWDAWTRYLGASAIEADTSDTADTGAA